MQRTKEEKSWNVWSIEMNSCPYSEEQILVRGNWSDLNGFVVLRECVNIEKLR